MFAAVLFRHPPSTLVANLQSIHQSHLTVSTSSHSLTGYHIVISIRLITSYNQKTYTHVITTDCTPQPFISITSHPYVGILLVYHVGLSVVQILQCMTIDWCTMDSRQQVCRLSVDGLLDVSLGGACLLITLQINITIEVTLCQK